MQQITGRLGMNIIWPIDQIIKKLKKPEFKE